MDGPAGELETVDYTAPGTSDVEFGYDVLGRRVSMVDQDGTSTWVWDSIGRLRSHTDPLAGTMTYGYNDAGPATSVTYPGGRTVALGYDGDTRPVTLEAWLGGPVGFGWDPASNLTSVDTGATGGVESSFDYDRVNRLTGTTLRQGATQIAGLGYVRDPRGLVSAVTGTALPGADDTYGYTLRDQLSSDSSGAYDYDLAGNLIGFPDGRRQAFDIDGRLCYQASTNTAPCEAPPTDAIVFDHDDHGNRTATRPAGAVPSTFGYDQADRLVEASVPVLDGHEGQYQPVTPTRVMQTAPAAGDCLPSPCGPLVAGVAKNVKVTGMAGIPTDGVAAVTLAVHVDGTPTQSIIAIDPSDAVVSSHVGLLANPGQLTTNTVIVRPGPDGRVKVVASTSGVMSIDVIGWHTEADATNTGGVLFEPAEPARRVVSTTSPVTGTCTPGPCSRLTAGSTTTLTVAGVNGIPTDVSAVAVVLHALAPTGEGWFTVWPTGSTAPGAAHVAYGTQAASGTTIVPVGPGGTIDLYSHNATDLVIDVVGWYTPATSGAGLVAHQADPEMIVDTRTGLGACDPSPCGRLPTGGAGTAVTVAGQGGIPAHADAVAVVVHAVDPTAAPAWLNVWPTGQAQPPTAQLTFGGGDLISGTVLVPVGADGQISVWSSTPVDVVIQTVGWYEDATQTWQYTYSGDGLRRTKTAPDGTVTTFTWDRSGNLPLLAAETIDAPGTSNDRTVRYVYGPAGRVLADITQPASGPEVLRWYHQDQLGSTIALTNQTGDLLATYDYTPFGKLATSTGTDTTPIGWAGEYRDDETGFTYLRARHYDPTTGQFLTRDPIEVLTQEAYSYAGNNPVNFTDPAGLYWGEGVVNGIGDLLGDVADGISCGADWLWDHKAQLAGIGAFGVCVFGSPAACLLMSRIAIVASSVDRAERSFSQPGGLGSAENWAQWGTGTLIDVGINWAAGGAVRAPVMRGVPVPVHAGRVTTMATQSVTAGGSYQAAVRMLRFTRQATWWNLGQLNVL